ncbi:ParB/RepB/Spo0J family partition protein [Chitinasiproducens palmae]|uniref:ParB family protein n=1 Tax=Chitinasiproducens palmae TaxID=1770053 RepID=A0A1H2PIS0_9BURK|nr:ParB/RepB/Spo0J family partition protein [Chitinasiproducens palmae]SDV46087.1 ParB family protein [Chitinasiproducens palmae]
MATKKNFSDSLSRGLRRENDLRTRVDDRFEKADHVLSDRPNGLLEPSSQRPVSGHLPPAVEALISGASVKKRFVRLPLQALVSNPLNSRSFYSPEAISARAASIQKEGQLVPVLVTPNPERAGEYFLIDGHYRRQAMQALGRTDIECCVLEQLAPIDFYRLSKALNHERESESVLDVALGLKRLREQGIARTDEDLVSIAGENASKISKLLALLDLPSSVQELMHEHPQTFGINIAYELALYLKASDTAATDALAKRIVAESLTFRKVEALRKALEQGIKSKKQLSRQYRLRDEGGQDLGTLKEWDSGRVVLDIRFDDTSKREALVDELRRRLGADAHARLDT